MQDFAGASDVPCAPGMAMITRDGRSGILLSGGRYLFCTFDNGGRA